MKKMILLLGCSLLMGSLLCAESIETHIPIKRPPTAFSLRFGVLGATTLSTGGITFNDMSGGLEKILTKAQQLGFIDLIALSGAEGYLQCSFLNAHMIKLNVTEEGNAHVHLSEQLINLTKGQVDIHRFINMPKLTELILQGRLDQNSLNSIVDPSKIVDFSKNYARANAFLDFGARYQLSGDEYSVSARISPFIPLVYTPAINTTAPRVSRSGSTINVSMEQFWYTSLSENKLLDLSATGLDFSLAGSYAFAKWIDLHLAVNNIPLLAGTLNKGYKLRYSFNIAPLTGRITNQSGPLGISPLQPVKISRLCKVRFDSDFRPLLNDYLIVSPFVAFPIGQDGPYYADSGMKLESHFVNILGAFYAFKYIDRRWQQEACFFVDSRWAHAMIGVSLLSDSITTLFSQPSIGIKAGLGFGL